MNLQELSYLQPNAILDIGANVGNWTKEAQKTWPDAEILMIEGNHECEPYLKETGIDYAICLLSDDVKRVKFYQRTCGGPSTGDSMYRENTDWYSDENVVVNDKLATTLDFVARRKQYDLAKIDSQGSELDILRGGENIVKGLKYIIMEIPVDSEHPPYNIGAPSRKEYLDYMDSIGFKLDK